jgi:hypothetical protein
MTTTRTPSPTIRRLPGGSIDLAHYVAHCHRERSLAAHGRLAAVWRGVTRIAGGFTLASPLPRIFRLRSILRYNATMIITAATARPGGETRHERSRTGRGISQGLA